MAAVEVKLGHIGSHWTAACKQAAKDFNVLFNRKGINVALALNGSGPKAGAVAMAPLQLSDDSVKMLKETWSRSASGWLSTSPPAADAALTTTLRGMD